jgi:hypothetical protein
MAALSEIGEALRSRLNRALAAQGLTAGVHLKDPNDPPLSSAVSVWLYQVLVDEMSRNNLPPTLPPPNALPPGAPVALGKRRRAVAPPLGVNLYYLVTPDTGTAAGDHNAVGAMLLALHESPLLRVPDVNNPARDEEIRIHLPIDSLEDRVRLWDTLKGRAYRLSFTCLLRTAFLHSNRTLDESLVLSVGSAPLPAGELR